MNVVERAIEKVGGRPSELARRLSEYAGEEISRQRVHGFRLRGIFPRDLIPAVHRLTGIDTVELITAKPKPHPRKPGITRALEFFDSSPKKMAAALTSMSEAGEVVTPQMVDGWLRRGKIPRGKVLDVALLTGIPVADLMDWPST
jgi:hypothetical protein